ncbi:MAG TPA: RHS repeat-associated core domain-containing protein [Thermoanaerobaculia bacterium]|jgi:RHS repeat-associated protein
MRLLILVIVASAALPAAGEAVPWNAGVSYHYDAAGNIWKIGEDIHVYDVVGRLVRSMTNGVWRHYEYDAFGNRTKCVQALGTPEETDCQAGVSVVPGTNRLGGGGVTYDPSGNLTNLAGHTYTYDAVDMIVRNDSAAGAVEYVYTADDERIAVYRAPAGSWQWTVRNLDHKPLREFTSQNGTTVATSNWQWTKDYVWREGLLLATRQADGSTFHYHLDHLGTPRRVTDGADYIAGYHDYKPFGLEVPDGRNETPLTRTKYTGHERDVDTVSPIDSLDYMHARYYSPNLGRFLSADPVLDIKEALHEPQLWNRYSYVTNNPLKFTDPDGRYRTFYKEKPMTAANLAMDENTPAVVKYSMYAVGGLTALGAGGVFFAPGSGGGLAAGAFRLHPIARGNFIETALATAFGGGLPRTFPVIDRFLNGVATSVKSMDLMSKTYQNANRLMSTLTGYVDKLANFNGGAVGQTVVRGSDVTTRVLEVVVQRGAANAQQMETIRKAAEYAKQNEVQLKVITVR